jgi:hypothetical protein
MVSRKGLPAPHLPSFVPAFSLHRGSPRVPRKVLGESSPYVAYSFLPAPGLRRWRIGFSWLAERPGELTVVFAGYQYRVSLLVAAILVGGDRRRRDDCLVGDQGHLEQPACGRALFPGQAARPGLSGAFHRHDRGRRRRFGARPPQEEGRAQTAEFRPGAADPSARRPGLAARRRSRRGAREVRGHAEGSRTEAARPARALSRGAPAGRERGGAPLCRTGRRRSRRRSSPGPPMPRWSG